MGNTIPTYKDPYEEKLKGYLQQMEERKPFQYDVGSDALYQQLRDNYEQQGKLAMEDTIGKAAAMTGGYGNSYAQTVGQQVYNQHMQQLNDTVPDLYGMALDRYQQEGQELRNKYDFYKGLSDEAYSKYLVENGLTGGNTPTYTSLDGKAQTEWQSKLKRNENWNGVTTTFTDMIVAEHDPIKAANYVLGHMNENIKPTEAELESWADILFEQGVSKEDVWDFLKKWAPKFDIDILTENGDVPGGNNTMK